MCDSCWPGYDLHNQTCVERYLGRSALLHTAASEWNKRNHKAGYIHDVDMLFLWPRRCRCSHGEAQVGSSCAKAGQENCTICRLIQMWLSYFLYPTARNLMKLEPSFEPVSLSWFHGTYITVFGRKVWHESHV